jgi:hypothetical protein
VFDKLRTLAGGAKTAQVERGGDGAGHATGAEAASRSLPKLALPTRKVIAHPRFVVTLTIWGAATGALGVLALSSVDIARISMVAGLGALGALARFLYAAIAAGVGGGVLFAAASLAAKLHSPRNRSCFFISLGEERIRPIDPASELGSDSLDAPLEATPFSRRRAELIGDHAAEPQGTQDGTLEPDPTSAFEDVLGDADEDVDEASGREVEVEGETAEGLDLGAVARILEEEAEETRETGEQSQPQAPMPATGIEKLRATPPEELSLVQLVERFAAALHDAQNTAPGDGRASGPGNGDASREQALAAALKALEMFTGDAHGQGARAAMADAGAQRDAVPPDGEDPAQHDLREALNRLDKVRGAA